MFDGTILVGLHLRQAQRTADTATRTAIGKALVDRTFIQDASASIMDSAIPQPKAGEMEAVGGGTLIAAFIAALMQNLPAILATIMAVFGLVNPTPAPSPAA